MDQEQRDDLHTMSPEAQQAAMGLAPEAEADLTGGPTGQEGDLPDLPPDQQLAAMGLTAEPEAATATGPSGLVEPEMEAYEAGRAEEEAPPTTRGGRKPRKTK